jgi:hypothetical protein
MEMQQMTECLLAKMDAMQQKIDANNEKFKVLQDALISLMDAHQERMMVCLGKTEATGLEANPEEKENVPVHWEVPKEEATVKPVRGLRKRNRGRNLATACTGTTRRATPVWRKGHIVRKEQIMDKVARGALKGQMFGRRH